MGIRRVVADLLKGVACNQLFMLLFIVSLLMIVGCSSPLDTGEEVVVETGNPDAKEVLTLNPEADIFQYKDVIYQTNIDWVDEKSLTKDEQVGEIRQRNETSTDFEDEMSNKLPVGAKIFTTKEENDMFLIVESAAGIKTYYALVEG